MRPVGPQLPRPVLLATVFMPVGQWPVPKVGFVFDGGELADDDINGIILDPEEHSAFEVRTLAQWAPALDKPTWQRLTAVHQARMTSRQLYLEIGPDGAH
ncbi:hypothetical protein ACIHFE_30905 [Streptomyces sp. NPDC052396]|uniref:hypothetical protein n=1 Tax=Streptomyces sp. NPDC052396 TaxID=3365689 RepID=UPI0037D25857